MNHFKKSYNKILNEEETSPKKRGRNGRIVFGLSRIKWVNNKIAIKIKNFSAQTSKIFFE